MSEWVSLSEAIKELGLPRETLKSKIHNGCIPFRKEGTQFKLNVKLARAFLLKEDIHNMEMVKKELRLNPFSNKKVKVRQVY